MAILSGGRHTFLVRARKQIILGFGKPCNFSPSYSTLPFQFAFAVTRYSHSHKTIRKQMRITVLQKKFTKVGPDYCLLILDFKETKKGLEKHY